MVGTRAGRRKDRVGPERGVAAVDGVDRIGAEDGPDRLDGVRWMDARSLPLEDGGRLRAPGLLVERSIAGEVAPVAIRQSHRAQPVGDALQGTPGVGDDAEAERAGDAEVSWVEVDLDQALPGGIAPVLVIGNVEVPHPRADHEQHIGLAAHLVAGRSEPQDIVRVIGWHGGATRHRGQHRATEQFDDLQQRCVRARTVHAGSRDHDRSLGGGEQLRCFGELCLRCLWPDASVGGRRENRRALVVPGGIEDRGGQLDVDGPGPPVPHLAKGQAEHFGDATPLEHRAAPLHCGAEQVELILALECRRRGGVDEAQPVL